MILIMSVFSRSSVCFSVGLRMHQNVLQNTYNYQIFWGSMLPDPPAMNDCRVAMFSTLANDITPQMGKVVYGPDWLATTTNRQLIKTNTP